METFSAVFASKLRKLIVVYMPHHCGSTSDPPPSIPAQLHRSQHINKIVYYCFLAFSTEFIIFQSFLEGCTDFHLVQQAIYMIYCSLQKPGWRHGMSVTLNHHHCAVIVLAEGRK